MKRTFNILLVVRRKRCDGIKCTNKFKKERMVNISEKVRGKELHGQLFRQTDEVASNKTWVYVGLPQGHLNKETEGLLMAAQTVIKN